MFFPEWFHFLCRTVLTEVVSRCSGNFIRNTKNDSKWHCKNCVRSNKEEFYTWRRNLLTWLCHITKPFLGITKGPQGEFKPEQATPRDKSGYVHPLLVEFSTGRKFLRSGVLFTRIHANRTKLWRSSRSKVRTLKSRSNFWPVRLKIWTARCEHSDRLNFSTAKAWLRGYSAGKKITKRLYVIDHSRKYHNIP